MATSVHAADAHARGWTARVLLLACACAALVGCTSLDYYGQAVRGQFEILVARQSIGRLLADADTPEALRARLRLVQSARVFAADVLGLPVGNRYTSYAELGRPYAVWNVFATPELSLSPRQWCYPVAGCVVYRGYFERAQAEAFAAQLRATGDDVYVGGVVAYSTLGWFDDPVLSSFGSLRDEDLVGLIFHETAHSLAYVPGDTRFNESFATFVEEQGLWQWYEAARDPDAAMKMRQERALRATFVRFVLGYRDELAALYAQGLPAAAMRARKAALFERMRAEYRATRGPLAGRYDRFFAGPLDNARLVTFSTYHDWVPAFAALHRRAGSWQAFHAQVRALANENTVARTAALERLRDVSTATTAAPAAVTPAPPVR